MKKTKSKYRPSAHKANKLMGQNFLVSQSVAESVVSAAGITKNDTVLEVGPGKGILTRILAKKARNVIAVEKDRELEKSLRKKFQNHANVTIISGDILKALLCLPKKYKIVANLPYYLTSRFLRLFLNPFSSPAPSSIAIMVQKEVAERICAKPPHMNMLALGVQAYGAASVIKRVGAANFKPKPKVDSAIIKIEKISDNFFKDEGIRAEEFFALAKKAFAQKRKKLRNTIGADSDMRPQELALGDWAQITRSRKTNLSYPK